MMNDDEVFFEKYAQMARSKQGLDGAGEWETLQKLLPDFEGKAVLDLGCGYGWHAAYVIEHGALSVTACDISEKMIAAARQKNALPGIDYRCEAFEDSEFPAESFDIIICSLMLHYLASYDEFLEKASRWLKRGGNLVFTVEHPIFTAYGSQDELAVMDGGKCILQLRGVRPFLSDKYDITKHPNFKYTADANPKNAFDIEAFLSARLKPKSSEVYDVYEVDATGDE